MKKIFARNIENKENIGFRQETKSDSENNTHSSIKFGKAIRSKLENKNKDVPRYSEPLRENIHVKERLSINLTETNMIDNDHDESNQEMRSETLNEHMLNFSRKSMFKTAKNVRFLEAQESDFLSGSSSKRSILKNSHSTDRLSPCSVNSHIGKISGGIGAKESLKDKGVNCDNRKYSSILRSLKNENKPFIDPLFPHGTSSLFHSKQLIKEHKDIKWVRIAELFKNKTLKLHDCLNSTIITVSKFSEMENIAISFNALGTSQRCIERIFEDQTYNELGIYYLRMNHEGIWKYVIVDDFIPVKQIGSNFIPIFLNVESTNSHPVAIWPFMLQKAMAKIFTNYECLFNDSLGNIMNELTGIQLELIDLNESSAERNELKISNLLVQGNILVTGEVQPTYYHTFPKPCALKENQNINVFSQEPEINLLSIDSNTKTIQLENLHEYFKSLHLYRIDESYYSEGCIIKQKQGTISLRTFKVEQYGTCIISVQQKDEKYFRNNGYEYVWMRIILVSKDIDGYRYIKGAYLKQKSVFLSCALSPGEYFVMVCGDWGDKVYEVTLNYQGNIEINMKRELVSSFPTLLSEMGRDLAQRFGNFKQLNSNICSYQHVDYQSGLIVENFNNERNRPVLLHKIYFLPFKSYLSIGNVDFAENGDSERSCMKKNRVREIEKTLEANANPSLILMLCGGINNEEFKKFSFN